MKEDKIEIFFDKVCKLLHLNFKAKTRNLLIQIFKFGIVGVIATLIDWLVFYITNDIMGIYYIICTILSFSVSVIYNYIASVKWVFNVNKEKDAKKNFIMFIVLSIVGLFLTVIIMKIGVDIFSIRAIFMKVISTVIVMIFNFITRKMFLE